MFAVLSRSRKRLLLKFMHGQYFLCLRWL